MSESELLGHVSFALIAISFLFKDMFWLRTISICASIFGIAYNYYAPATPLWLVIGWNIVFMAINLYQILAMIKDRLEARFTRDEEKLANSLFVKLSRVDCHKLLSAGQWQLAEAKQTLMTQGHDLFNVVLLFDGMVEIFRDGQKIREVEAHSFVEESCIIDARPSSVSAIAARDSKLLVWSHQVLSTLMNEVPSIKAHFEEIIARDLEEVAMEDDIKIADLQRLRT